MCLEVYCPEAAITLRYEREQVVFFDTSRISCSYLCLIENSSGHDIDRLIVLYPKPLFTLVSEGKVTLRGVTDLTRDLADPSKRSLNGELRNGVFTASDIPNPNTPHKPLPGLSGVLDWQSTKLSIISGFQAHHSDILRIHQLTAFQINFGKRPIRPGDGRWLWLGIDVRHPGTPLAAGRVLHELAAPIRVRRRVQAELLAAIDDVPLDIEKDKSIDEWARETVKYEETLDLLGLAPHQQREVDIAYHQLKVLVDSRGCLLNHANVEGDIRGMAASPQLMKCRLSDGSAIEVESHDWKSGSILRPRNPLGEAGFVIKLQFAAPSSAESRA